MRYRSYLFFHLLRWLVAAGSRRVLLRFVSGYDERGGVEAELDLRLNRYTSEVVECTPLASQSKTIPLNGQIDSQRVI